MYVCSKVFILLSFSNVKPFYIFKICYQYNLRTSPVYNNYQSFSRSSSVIFADDTNIRLSDKNLEHLTGTKQIIKLSARGILSGSLTMEYH